MSHPLTAPGVIAGVAMTLSICVKVLPPSTDLLIQIEVGPKQSWYISATTALLVGSPFFGTDAAIQSRSTPNGEQLVPQELALPVTVLVPRTHDLPPLVDFHTSACNGAPSSLPARLHA